MTYSDFINNHQIYTNQKDARAKGFEAHHIIPISLQEEFDDRCVRLTPFEHVYAHYLLALEDKKAVPVFYAMANINAFKLSDNETEIIQGLEKIAQFREEGVENMRKSLLGKHTSPDTEWKKGCTPWNKGLKLSDEHKQKLKGRVSPMRGKHHTDDTKKKMSEVHKGNRNFEKNRFNPKGRHWFNNGEVSVMAFECPNGFTPGRIGWAKSSTNCVSE